MPTITSKARAGIRFAAKPPSGAAASPPIKRPIIALVKFSAPRVTMKVAEMVTERKNSAVLTVPITFRGCTPWTSRLEVTIGPQPPPPAASRKPPMKPSGPTTRGFFS